MRPLPLLLLYLLLVFTGAALLSPWLYWAVLELAAHFDSLGGLARTPFHRYVNRSLLILALLGLWPFLRALRVGSWADLGFSPRSALREVAPGFLVGFASLALLALLVLTLGPRRLASHSGAEFLQHLLNAGLAALVVATLEELVFRGAVFGALRRAHSMTVALLSSSALYAWVHFFSRPPAPARVEWNSGFLILPEMFRGLADPGALFPGFLNLTMVGIILALAYARRGTLYFSIGLHAGWIFWVKTFGFFTVETSAAAASRGFWGSSRLIDGWAALLILIPVLAWAARPNFRKNPTLPA